MKKIFFTLLITSLTTVSFGNALTLDRFLKRGMVGEDVKILQEILAKSNIGFYESGITGYYGPLTAQAVSNLQNKYGIESVGFVGPKTIKVINNLNETNQVNQVSKSNNIVNQNTASSVTMGMVTGMVINTNVTKKVNTNTNNVNLSAKSITNNISTINNSGVVKNIKQNETRSKSNEYNKVFNENKDVNTGFVKPSFATSTTGVSKIIVRYKTQPTITDEDKIISRSGTKKKVHNLVPVISAEVADTDIDKISSDPNVLSIEKDEPVSIKSDLEYANTWGVANTGAKTVYNSGVTGKGVKVAVLDTGIDYNHSDLNLNYAGGYNFITGTTDPLDDNGHGTHVSGTISALNNGVGVVGEAPDAKIYALKVLDATGAGYSSSVIAALDWAVANGIQVVNLSFGTPNYPGTAMEDAFINAEAKGLVVVVSVGNSGTCAGDTDTVNYPARFASVISVGATDSNNVHTCFSSAGPNLELSAPGALINSTRLNGGEILYSGTSMASPHVAGVAADIISAGVKDLNGNGRINDEVRNILDKTALDLGATGRDNVYGYGLVKVDNAIAYLSTINNPAPTPIATTTPVIATTTPTTITSPVIIPVATTTPVTSPVATSTPIVTPVITPVVSPVTTNPVVSPIVIPITQPVLTSPSPITQPVTAPIISPSPITSPVSPIAPVASPIRVINPVASPAISNPKPLEQDYNRPKIDNESENRSKGIQGNLKRTENSNSNRNESGKRFR